MDTAQTEPLPSSESFLSLTSIAGPTSLLNSELTPMEESEPVVRPLTPASYLGNQILYIPNNEFLLLIQDRGILNINPSTDKAYSQKPRFHHHGKETSFLFKDIY